MRNISGFEMIKSLKKIVKIAEKGKTVQNVLISIFKFKYHSKDLYSIKFMFLTNWK